jgi:hypothetical protein
VTLASQALWHWSIGVARGSVTGMARPSVLAGMVAPRARLIAAGLLGALAVCALVIIGDTSGAWIAASGAKAEIGRTAWFITACFAAVVARPDRRGLLAAWIGGLIAAVVLSPFYLDRSPTTSGSPFYISLMVVFLMVSATAVLALALWAVRSIRSATAPASAARILGGVLLVMVLSTAAILAYAPGPEAEGGPQPAPTAPD